VSTTSREADQLDRAKAEAFQHKFVQDLAAVAGFACASIGDRLNLYKAMASGGPVTSEQLAEATSTHERYVREWLINQAAGGYLEYDPTTRRYSLPAEHAAVLADEESPYHCGGALQLFMALLQAESNISQCFVSGKGMLWAEHDPGLFLGTERFFRPAYMWQLIPQWLPSIHGLPDKLHSGAKVADVGCGHGVSTLVMANAFPLSHFSGFDNHVRSIEAAIDSARKGGPVKNVSFEACEASAFPGNDYDLVTFFDCLHDMGDPVSACRRAAQALAKDGVVMIVEPMAGKTVEDNFNPVGRLLSGASVLCCTPNAIASGNHSLGTIASDEALAAVARAGGLTQFRRVCETPFNRVFEARP